MKRKHKLLSAFIATVMAFGTFAAGVLPAKAQTVLLGDVDLNGKVQSLDALYVLESVAGLRQLTEPQKMAADVNGTGVINGVCALRILEYVAGVIPDFGRRAVLNTNGVILQPGETLELIAAVSTVSGAVWSSGDETVAKVSQTGLVTALAAGVTTVVVKVNGATAAECVVQVGCQGIDVSVWQGDINWQKVQDSGVTFAMIRSGFGYAADGSQVDKKFKQNVAGAKAAGIMTGAYHYSYAESVEEAIREADFMISLIDDYSWEYPICLDLEDPSLTHLGKQKLTDIALAFLNRLQEKGYYAMLYANLNWTRNYLDMSRLRAFDFWLAEWGNKITYDGEVGIWQYSSKGRINGINGNVDLNKCFKDYPEIIKNAGLNNL